MEEIGRSVVEKSFAEVVCSAVSERGLKTLGKRRRRDACLVRCRRENQGGRQVREDLGGLRGGV